MTHNLSNREVASVLQRLGDLLEIRGEAVFKIAAYRRAAESIATLAEPVRSIRDRGELQKIPGVGKAIAEKVSSLLDTGSFKLLDEVQAEIPPGVAELLTVPEIGAKRARVLYDRLGIDSLEALKAAVAEGRLHGTGGLGPRAVERIAEGLASLRPTSQGLPIGTAYALGTELLRLIEQIAPALKGVQVAGEVRRYREMVNEITLVAAVDDPAELVHQFCAQPIVSRVEDRNDVAGRVILENGANVSLHVVHPEAFPVALVLYTGSEEHVRRLQSLGTAGQLSISRDGLVRDGQKVQCRSEEEVYARLGLQYIPPPMREDTGEIELALRGELPLAIDASMLKGDLHTHTEWSDGKATVLEMGLAARAMGYRYMCLTDHSRSLGVANGLGPERLELQRAEIQSANAELAPFRILQGIELEVLGDGTLDLPDETLAELDLVIASVHSGLRKSREVVTSRALAAIRHPLVDILAHPTGRLVGGRPGGDFNMEVLVQEAARTGTVLEIDSEPARLDLRDTHVRLALDAGCSLSIDSDAHSTGGLSTVHFGAGVATRAMATPDRILNTLPLVEMLAALKRNRQ